MRTTVGNIPKILQTLDVRHLIIGKQFENSDNYEEFLRVAREENVEVTVVEAGQRIGIEPTLYLEVLFPDSQNVIKDNVLNNNSLVFKLVYKDFSMLFTGDIEELAEKEIIKKYSDTDILNCDVLKVAHHGSKSSSIQEILEKIIPQIAVIGVGSDNKYGHPNKDVLSRLQKIGTKIYRTDENGEITIKTNGKRIKIEKIIK